MPPRAIKCLKFCVVYEMTLFDLPLWIFRLEDADFQPEAGIFLACFLTGFPLYGFHRWFSFLRCCL